MLTAEQITKARLIRQHGGLNLMVVYAILFLSCGAAGDLIGMFSGGSPSSRYLFPLPLALTFWLGLQSWARRSVLRERQEPG